MWTGFGRGLEATALSWLIALSYSLPIWDSTNSSLQCSVLCALFFLSPFFPSPPSTLHLLEDPGDIAQAGLGLAASRF